MSKIGDSLIMGMTEALAIAKGEEPAARITLAGFHYVPESAVATAIMAERERCAEVADNHGFESDNDGCQGCGEEIADAIRKGPAP